MDEKQAKQYTTWPKSDKTKKWYTPFRYVISRF